MRDDTMNRNEKDSAQTSQVESEMDHLGRAVGMAHEVMLELEDRLASVLRITDGGNQADAVPGPHPLPDKLVPHAAHLNEVRMRVCLTTVLMRSVLARLEL